MLCPYNFHLSVAYITPGTEVTCLVCIHLVTFVGDVVVTGIVPALFEFPLGTVKSCCSVINV